MSKDPRGNLRSWNGKSTNAPATERVWDGKTTPQRVFPPVERGNWVLDLNFGAITHRALNASAWWLDVRTVLTAVDVLELARCAEDKSFVSHRDICDLLQLVRTYLRDRPRR